MKTKTMILVFSSIVGLLTIFGFSKDKKKEKTGDFVFIPMGSTTINDKVVSLDSYWISDHEITNKEYNEFLADLKNQGQTDVYEICKIQSEKWKTNLGEQNTPYADYYSSHEAYARYPVLNISHQAAKLYCDWLTEKSEDKTQIFRLPTKKEWIYAARGGFEHSKYSWGGMYLRNDNGECMCNFKRIGDEFIHLDKESGFKIIPEYKELKRNSAIPAPVDSYWANEYGLFNACGNVAEMIVESGIAMGGNWNSTGYDVQVTSELKYDEPNPFVGFRPVRVNK
jgi:formylglycine-generating enzyme required for sulfatase activity